MKKSEITSILGNRSVSWGKNDLCDMGSPLTGFDKTCLRFGAAGINAEHLMERLQDGSKIYAGGVDVTEKMIRALA